MTLVAYTNEEIKNSAHLNICARELQCSRAETAANTFNMPSLCVFLLSRPKCQLGTANIEGVCCNNLSTVAPNRKANFRMKAKKATEYLKKDQQRNFKNLQSWTSLGTICRKGANTTLPPRLHDMRSNDDSPIPAFLNKIVLQGGKSRRISGTQSVGARWTPINHDLRSQPN